MRFHWVNQKKTGKEEIAGGYMWCPKTKSNGARNPFYEMMRSVEVGDVVFSFRNGLITNIGIVVSECFEARKPEFGRRGEGWLDLGWKVLVEYDSVPAGFLPKLHMDVLRPLLPTMYSPMKPDGSGYERYFMNLSDELGLKLLELSKYTSDMLQVLRLTAQGAIDRACNEIAYEAEMIRRLDEQFIESRPIPETQKQALISARIGQGAFRNAVLQIEPQCRITGVADTRFLRASHIKPWRNSADHERLDGNNGLMLTPTIDALFDGGYMTFTNSGCPRLTSIVPNAIWMSLGLSNAEKLSTGPFHAPQKEYLQYHRDVIYRR